VVQVSSPIWLALACGLAMGLGLWSLFSRLPALTPPRLTTRLAPYLLDVSAEARRVHRAPDVDPLPVLGVVAAPALDLFQRVFGAVLGTSGRTLLHLRRAGRGWSVEGYRLRQLVWTVAGALGGAALGAVALAAGGAPGGFAAGPVVGAGLGLLLRERLLVAEGTRRAARIESELPTVLEFLALSLSAGEGVHDALRRVAAVGSGTLPDLVRRVVAEVAVGVPLGDALTRMGDELRIPSLTRCLAHVVGALERGSPLAEVLRVQAADAREAARRSLLEAAGRKEIAMMVPLVFLILPVTIAFAVFPGILVLQTQL
jgi:tight adherence protein C